MPCRSTEGSVTERGKIKGGKMTKSVRNDEPLEVVSNRLEVRWHPGAVHDDLVSREFVLRLLHQDHRPNGRVAVPQFAT